MKWKCAAISLLSSLIPLQLQSASIMLILHPHLPHRVNLYTFADNYNKYLVGGWRGGMAGWIEWPIYFHTGIQSPCLLCEGSPVTYNIPSQSQCVLTVKCRHHSLQISPFVSFFLFYATRGSDDQNADWAIKQYNGMIYILFKWMSCELRAN